MFRRCGFGFLLSLVFVLFAYSSAVADTPVFNSKDGKVYGSISLGATFLNDLDFDLAGQTAHGFTGTGSGTASFEAGTSFSGALGYVISDKIRTEIELGYQEMRYDKVDVTAGDITDAAGATVTYAAGEYEVSGEIDALTVSTNVIFTPVGNKTLFGGSVTPLVGGGIGFVDWESKINFIATQTLNGKEDDTDFLASIMAGLEYTNSQQVTWSIKYRHFWADTGKNGVDDAEADNIVANLKIAF
jgi:opacity protein-like surface antigen